MFRVRIHVSRARPRAGHIKVPHRNSLHFHRVTTRSASCAHFTRDQLLGLHQICKYVVGQLDVLPQVFDVDGRRLALVLACPRSLLVLLRVALREDRPLGLRIALVRLGALIDSEKTMAMLHQGVKARLASRNEM